MAARCLFTCLIDKTDPVDKTRLLFKLTDFNKNSLAIHDKENGFEFGKKRKGVVDLDSFLALPTDGCCQLTVANWQQIHSRISNAVPITYCCWES